jgi:ferredoxin-NADP reductase
MSMPRKIRCTVEAITDHGGHVYTVDLKPEIPVPLFRPGQFLHLTVDDFDPSSFWPESRVFSIASSPQDREHLRICYSVVRSYTRKMERKLKVGGMVWVKLPYGDFVIDPTSDAVLLAGGTGVSAFTAFLEALTPEHARSVTLVYGARNPQLFLFKDMVMRQLEKAPNFRIIFFAESAPPAWNEGAAPSFLGRISLEKAWPLLPEPSNQVFYVSGPPVMLKALSADLQSRGVPAERIRIDAWE